MNPINGPAQRPRLLLYSDSRFLLHETGEHPENSGRLRSISRKFEKSVVTANCDLGAVIPAEFDWLEAVHDPGYLQRLQSFAASGGGRLDPDTVVSRVSFEVACAAAGAACAAVEQVVQGKYRRALCLVRPPGHHALQDRGMGFCLINNIAVAARHAQRACGLKRILIVDWDVHHGNGTQEIFYEDSEIHFFSIHRFPFYPGTGEIGETGTGSGLGATLNVPVRFGTSRENFFDLFQRGLDAAVRRCRPELILLSAGFDAHRLDPIGSLGLETEDFGRLTEIVAAAAETECEGRIVSLLEGGYHPEALADSVELHLQKLMPRADS